MLKVLETAAFSSEEKNILKVAYSEERIGKMTDSVKFHNGAQALLVRITLITGWELPKDEMLLVFLDEFKKWLVEILPDVNFSEISAAIRKYGTTIKDWGKKLNLNLIYQAVVPYLNERYDASELLRQKMQANTPQLPIPKLSEDEILLSTIDYWMDSKFKRIDFLNPTCYDILVKRGEINLDEDQKEKIRNKAIVYVKGNSADQKKDLENKIFMSIISKKIALSEYLTISGEDLRGKIKNK